ncbi:MAG: hypothetical protein JWM39_819 [Parcubacteria group bacterium]|nr:hypothetical protein [Parcubacteria group bacterium]
MRLWAVLLLRYNNGMSSYKNLIKQLLAARGYEIRKIDEPDSDPAFKVVHEAVRDATMTSRERQQALYQAVNYIADNNIEGDIVECGVWKGGSSMISALALKAKHQTDRKLYLYDTFAGMSAPTKEDVSLHGTAAQGKWEALADGDKNLWDYASLKEVQGNLATTGYPKDNLIFVSGKVEDTIPATMPERIAVLRLDTDWYESTKHELEHLFPLLVPGGVLIIDDYGHWQGARQAVDEYLATQPPMFLARIDYTGRIGIKARL